MNERLERLKAFLRGFVPTVTFEASGERIQIFNTRGMFPDPMERIYYADDIKVDFCPSYIYLDIFGLTDDEFAEICKEFDY